MIRILYFMREEFPSHRVDIEVLFGRELAARGNAIDLVMQASNTNFKGGSYDWFGRTVFVGSTRNPSGVVNRLLKQLLGFWHDSRSLLRLASADVYDAIQVRDKFIIAIIALAVARVRGLKFIFWLSFPYPEDDILRAREGKSRCNALVYARGVLSGWLLYRWILPKCSHAFVQSRQMLSDVCEHGINHTKLTAVPMGIDAAELAACRDDGLKLRVPTQSVTLAYLGTLNSVRRLEVLIDMLALLREQDLDVKLLLIGDGDLPTDRQRLENRADELRVRDRLQITGFLPRLAALKCMCTASIGLSPFFPTPVLRSTSPTKLVEYMALGVPVVGNDHPEQRLIIKESRSGVCVPWGARHFARAVRWIVRNSPQDQFAMGERGRAWVLANRTYSQIANSVEEKYLELLCRNGSVRKENP